jgi:hypothetical protein
MYPLFGHAETCRLFCRACYRQVFALRWRTDFGRHELAAVLTLGMCLGVVAAVAVWRRMTAPGYRCPNCGRRCRARPAPAGGATA